MPIEAITVECASESTIENAAFSAPVLAAMGARSTLLVTSWFHTRRALPSFRKEAPEIHWMSAPVERGEPLWRLARDHNGLELAEEHVKPGCYGLCYGVSLDPKADEVQQAAPVS